MMQSKNMKRLLWFFLIIIILFLISRFMETKSNEKTVVIQPTNIPLKSFIKGDWIAIEAYDEKKKPLENKYEIIFENDDIVKFIVLNKDGFLLNGSTSTYSFINTNVIYIDDKRMIGGDTWVLERDKQDLIIVSKTISTYTQFRFQRKTR